jgi:hypothetical protein
VISEHRGVAASMVVLLGSRRRAARKLRHRTGSGERNDPAEQPTPREFSHS